MTSTANTAAKPTHRIFNVTGQGDKSTWTEIGAAWSHKDGDGFSIKATALPLEGRIVMRRIAKPVKRSRASA